MRLFDQAVALPISERAARVEKVRIDHPSLADELSQLLTHDGPCRDIFDSQEGRLHLALAGASAELLAGFDAQISRIDTGTDPLLGTEVEGRHRLDERIGAGGMGRVYRAFDRLENRDVAIKILLPELTNNERQVRRFRRELRAVSRLAHPGCVAVYGAGCHREYRYIVMEYVRGGSLERLSGAPAEELLPILMALAETLDYVHECRILHRDIKPANVLIVPGLRPWPKLVDFGIAHLPDDDAGRLTDTGAILGSIDFMAPEQIEGKPLDCRCDLYSFGCLIYSLWTKNPPFLGTPMQRMRQRFDIDAPTLRSRAPHAPPRLDTLVARLLRRDRSQRPESAREVARELAMTLAELQTREATHVA